jgi:hypothetical protein
MSIRRVVYPTLVVTDRQEEELLNYGFVGVLLSNERSTDRVVLTPTGGYYKREYEDQEQSTGERREPAK